MKITYTISQLERQKSDGLVTTVHYTVNAVLGNHSARHYGTVSLERSALITPYASLKEPQVIAWVKAEIDVKAIEANLAAQIESLKNPVTATGTPW
jgi:hypothetical protein